jgi:hypothetical protein
MFPKKSGADTGWDGVGSWKSGGRGDGGDAGRTC